MELAIWLASILGPVFAIIGLWMLVRTHDVEKVWSSFKSTPGLVYVAAFVNLILGLTVLSLYHTWSWNLAVVVTIVGYLQFLRGVAILFAHDWMLRLHAKLLKRENVRVFGCGPFILGLLLCWYAFGGTC